MISIPTVGVLREGRIGVLVELPAQRRLLGERNAPRQPRTRFRGQRAGGIVLPHPTSDAANTDLEEAHGFRIGHAALNGCNHPRTQVDRIGFHALMIPENQILCS